MNLLSIIFVLLISFLPLIPIEANTGICDISGSGIGGTGAPVLKDNGSGIGGTGALANTSGIGGTGAPALIDSGSGIGGTGQKTDKQTSIIIGTITGFGSICVNGIEIHYAASTPVQVNGSTSNTDQLALGQIVSVNVSGTGNEVFAQDIEVLNIVTGPVTEIDPQLNRLTVLGQKVLLSDKTQFPQSNIKLSHIQKGSFIQVSGLRQTDGYIVASRIDNSNSTNYVQITGSVSNVTSKSFTVQGVNFSTTNSLPIRNGQEVNVRGQLEAERIIAEKITIPTIVKGKNFTIEGLVDFDNKENHIKIGHIELNVTDQLKETLSDLPNNQSIIFSGSIDEDNEAKVEHIFIKDFIDKHEIEHIRQLSNNETRNIKDEDYYSKINQTERLETTDSSERPESEDSETAEIKETEQPELKEHETPDLPGIKEPELPEFEVPETPESPGIEEPELPEFEVPEIPELPEIEEPELPELEST